MEFNEFIFYGYIVKGEFNQALSYVRQFTSQQERQANYRKRFDDAHFIEYEVAPLLNEILTHYQQYYRDVFYLEELEQEAYERLKQGLMSTLNVNQIVKDVEQLENEHIAPLFRQHGLHFLGGRTSGYFGPYIWRQSEEKTYEVELPEGVQQYTVKLLSDFIMKSWIAYLSLDEISAGGWTGKDGIINCIKDTYDLDSENFTVSLLKHEAQHVLDLARYPQIELEELEYRAKLVELIYTSERNLLKVFIHQARNSDAYNGHALAAHKIISNFEQATTENLQELSIETIQCIARELFERNCAERQQD